MNKLISTLSQRGETASSHSQQVKFSCCIKTVASLRHSLRHSFGIGTFMNRSQHYLGAIWPIASRILMQWAFFKGAKILFQHWIFCIFPKRSEVQGRLGKLSQLKWKTLIFGVVEELRCSSHSSLKDNHTMKCTCINSKSFNTGPFYRLWDFLFVPYNETTMMSDNNVLLLRFTIFLSRLEVYFFSAVDTQRS